MREAILPDWWDEECEADPALLPDVEIRVARFMGIGLSDVRSGQVLAPPSYAGVQLRRVQTLDRARLAPAIHTALQVASAVVRSLRPTVAPVEMPPDDGLSWRRHVELSGGSENAIGLSDILSDLWKRGVPVVPLDLLPAPSFQGMACIIGDRPVVLLGHKHDAPGRVAFFMAHEVGHIAKGHCTPDHPIVDEDEEVSDDTDVENIAEQYAVRSLFGGKDVTITDVATYRELANKAAQIGQVKKVDPGAIIFRWAHLTKDYAMASMAAQALYQASGARRLVRSCFDTHVDLDSATESDRSLLLCVYGDPERHESSR